MGASQFLPPKTGPMYIPQTCIFGCDADDDLCHYLKCEVLWTLVYSCFNCNVSIFTQTAQHRASVCDMNTCSLAHLYTAYSSYHSLRKLHSDIIHNAISSDFFDLVYDETLNLLNLFKADTKRGPFG